MNDHKLKKWIVAALMAALTCIATMIIKIPTPTFGYIHLGDGLVLLCGIILGPLGGAFAAGIGSMFSDIFSGYITWAPATLIIKGLTAGIAGMIFHKTPSSSFFHKNTSVLVIFCGLLGESFMVIGYFLYEAALAALASGSLNSATIGAGFVSSATGIPFNIVQGLVGILLSIFLLRILVKIPEVREWMNVK